MELQKLLQEMVQGKRSSFKTGIKKRIPYTKTNLEVLQQNLREEAMVTLGLSQR